MPSSSSRRVHAVFLVAVGGFLGATLRFTVGLVAPGLTGTLLVNAVGSLLLGVVVSESVRSDLLSDLSRRLIATGLLSSFTTYSTFALESVQAGPVLGLANVVASYGLGIAGVLLGRRLAGRLKVRR
jgi:CrcB protein